MIQKKHILVRSGTNGLDEVEIIVRINLSREYRFTNHLLSRLKTHKEADHVINEKKREMVRDLWFETYGELFTEIQRLRVEVSQLVLGSNCLNPKSYSDIELAFNRMINLLTPPEP